jgi:hypothetical protein
MAVLPLWGLYEIENRNKQFWISFVALFLIVPPISALASEFLFGELKNISLQYSRGFSGIAVALAGFLLVTTLEMFERYQAKETQHLTIGGVSVLSLAVLAAVTNEDPISMVFGGLAVAVIGMLLVFWKLGYVANLMKVLRWSKQNPKLAWTAYFGLFVAIAAIQTTVPTNPIRNGSIVNFVAHGTGFIVGMALPWTLNSVFERKRQSN